MLRTTCSCPIPRRRYHTSSIVWNNPRPRVTEPVKTNQDTPAHPQLTSLDIPSTPPTTEDSRASLSPYDLNLVKQRIRGWSGQAALTVRNRADELTTTTKSKFSQMGAHLNKVTGYEEIEALKRSVVEQERRIDATRQAARQAKIAYGKAVIQRSHSQREVNDLLQRKSLWVDSDLSRFTTMVRQDHAYEQEELRAKAAVDEAEDGVEREFSQLLRTILARYHEEQVWSDKIRSVSTYGSLAVLGLNLVVFLMAIVVVEPWKRRRLAQTFERKIEELSVENAAKLDASMQLIGKHLTEQEQLLEILAGNVIQKADNDAEGVQEKEMPLTEVLHFKLPFERYATQRTLELAVVGSGAFLTGIIGCLLFGR